MTDLVQLGFCIMGIVTIDILQWLGHNNGGV